jgi:hypothetical protein
VFVLLSLFVGVIITSMELLREGVQEENEVWKKVKLMQKSHTLDDASIDNLLEIFNLVDLGQNGKLTVCPLTLFVCFCLSLFLSLFPCLCPSLCLSVSSLLASI